MSRPAASRRRRAAVGYAIGGKAAVAAGLTALSARPPGGAERWRRLNFRGRRPTLLAGPAVTIGLSFTLSRVAPPAAAVCAGAGLLGAYDDHFGDSHARGLRGHLRALRAGRVTTGMVKLAGLVAVGAVAAGAERRSRTGALVDVALIAGTANLVNLLDLRPGRALKVVIATAAPLTAAPGPAGRAAAAVAGASLAVLGPDLREEVMLGDCGANALGAVVGWLAARALPAGGRCAVLAGVVGLTLLSERTSFSAAIETRPWLAAIDGWGRRP